MGETPEKLEEKCLLFIVENFEWYSWAFQFRHQSRVLARHFQLLALAFSETLFLRLKECGKLRREFFSFLINPHLQNLDIEGMDEQLITPNFIRQLGIHGHNIVNFKARLSEVSLYKELFPLLPNVEIIEINGICLPATLEVIGTCCPVLRVLKGALLSSSKTNMISDEEFSAICFLLDNCDNLEALDYGEVNGLVVQVLCKRHQNDLECNTLEKCRKYSLKKLSFGWRISNMENALKICSIVCPSVSSVMLCGLTKDYELCLCSDFKRLEDVTISLAQIGQNAMKQFLKSTEQRLIRFELSHGPLCILTLVKHCTNLQSLTLYDVTFLAFDEDKCLTKPCLSNLRTLSLVKADFSNDTTVRSVKLVFSISRSIKNLSVLHCEGLTNEFINSMLELGCHSLINLELSKASLSFLTLATHCAKLQTLTLSDVTVLAFDAENLSSTVNLSLKNVTLTNVNFSEKAALVSLQLILSLSKNIRKLSVNHCKGLTDNFIKSILKKLCFHKIHELNSGSYIGVCPSVEELLVGSLKNLSIKNCRCIRYKDNSHLFVFKKVDQSKSKWIMSHNTDEAVSYKEYDDCYCSSDESSEYDYDYDDVYIPMSDEEGFYLYN